MGPGWKLADCRLGRQVSGWVFLPLSLSLSRRMKPSEVYFFWNLVSSFCRSFLLSDLMWSHVTLVTSGFDWQMLLSVLSRIALSGLDPQWSKIKWISVNPDSRSLRWRETLLQCRVIVDPSDSVALAAAFVWIVRGGAGEAAKLG